MIDHNSISVSTNDTIPEQKRYMCIFCKTEKEWSVANKIMFLYEGVRALPVQQVKRFSHNGKTERKMKIIFPGYVFAKIPIGLDTIDKKALEDAFKILHTEESIFLQGKDRTFAEWLFSINGVIGFSKAMQEGNRVRIVDGPLKFFEGKILKIDKRNTNALIAMEFGNQIIKTWLGYDLIEPTKE